MFIIMHLDSKTNQFSRSEIYPGEYTLKRAQQITKNLGSSFKYQKAG